MFEEIDPRLTSATGQVLAICMALDAAERPRVLEAVRRLLDFADSDQKPALFMRARPTKQRCSLCNKLGHKRTACPNARRCSRCNAIGHDRRNCPDLETVP